QQAYRNLELLVVDDGSRDGSRSLIEQVLQGGGPGIQARLLTQENGGAHSAINRGLSEARGEYLTILNSDDYYHPQRIETLVDAASRGGSELFFTLLDIV